MKSIIALTLLALVAVATSRGTPKNVITDIIENIINKNRDKLANLTIPLIDTGAFGNVTNLVIVGAEQFVLEKLEAAGPLSVDIKNATITLAVASATADMVAIGVEIPEIGASINGVGTISGSAEEMRLTVALDLKLDGLTPTLVDFSSLDITVAKINANLQGIDNQEETNQILSSKLAPFLSANLAVMANENKEVIIEAINAILAGLTL